MKKIALTITILLLVCSFASAKDKGCVTATDIQKVDLNDTLEDVSKKIGDPYQVLSKELTDGGEEKVIWLYEAIKKPKRDVPNPVFWKEGETLLEYEQRYSVLRNQNPPYLIIFLNGKVSKIERQPIDVSAVEPLKIKVDK